MSFSFGTKWRRNLDCSVYPGYARLCAIFGRWDTYAEPSRIPNRPRVLLKDGGTAALLWNLRRDSNTELARAYEALLQQHGRNYPAIKKSWYVEPETLQTFFGHTDYASETFYYAGDLGFTALRGRFDSASFAPRPEDDDYQETVTKLRDMFERYQEGGTVKVEHDCRMYYGKFR